MSKYKIEQIKDGKKIKWGIRRSDGVLVNNIKLEDKAKVQGYLDFLRVMYEQDNESK